MAAIRHLAAEVHNGLCTAWRRLVRHVGGVDVLAAGIGVQRSHASEFGAPHSGRSPTLAVALEADALAGEPIMASALAAAQGYRLVPVTPGAAGDLHLLAGRVVAEVGQAFGVLSEASADGHVCAAERAALVREFSDVVAAGERVLAALRRGDGA